MRTKDRSNSTASQSKWRGANWGGAIVLLLVVVVVLSCGVVGMNPVSSDKMPPCNVDATVLIEPLAICIGAVE